MYEASYPDAHIIASYKSEADCFKDFFRDSSNRLIIVGRGLNRKEEKYMIDSLGYNPGCNPVASDAVTVIVNANSNDTLFSLNSLQQLLSGKSYVNHKTVVFDGLNATSTVRFIKDSILSISYLEEKSNISMQLISANDSLLNNSTCSNQQKFKTLDAEFRNKSSKITSNVLIGCAISILISAIGYYQSAIDDIAYIMTQGFTGTALFSLAFDIIKNASPWWKAAAILVSFGACVLPSIE
jgi:hypothetical protein